MQLLNPPAVPGVDYVISWNIQYEFDGFDGQTEEAAASANHPLPSRVSGDTRVFTLSGRAQIPVWRLRGHFRDSPKR